MGYSLDAMTIRRIAVALLEDVSGSGMWVKEHESYSKVKGDPIPGLSVGDLVYWYDTDESKVMSKPVVVAQGGVGWILRGCLLAPHLQAVTQGWFSLTMKEAVVAGMEEIANDLEWAQKRAVEAESLKELLRIGRNDSSVVARS